MKPDQNTIDSVRQCKTLTNWEDKFAEWLPNQPWTRARLYMVVKHIEVYSNYSKMELNYRSSGEETWLMSYLEPLKRAIAERIQHPYFIFFDTQPET